MDERPSIRRLVGVALAPWLVLAAVYPLPLLHWVGWRIISGPVLALWIYAVVVSALLLGAGLFAFGAARLVRQPIYRRSWYGWARTAAVGLSTCGLGLFIRH